MLEFALTGQSLAGLLTGDTALLASDPVGYEVLPVPLIRGSMMANAPTGRYRVEEDVTETLADGRVIQVAVKGTDMTMTEAVRLGLVKNDQYVGPSEVKANDERVNEQAARAMQENTGDKNAEAPSVVRERQTREAAERAVEAATEEPAPRAQRAK